MTADDKAYHAMVHATIRTRSQHAPVSAAPPALVRAFDDLVAVEARLNANRRRQEGSGLEAITEEKLTLQRAAVAAILLVIGTVHSLAGETADTDLLITSSTSTYDLLNLPDQDFANRANDLLGLITPERRPLLISDYGLTADMEENARDLLEEFADRIGTPRDEIIARKTAGQEIARAIADARYILKNRLDPLMRQFNLQGTDPATLAKKAFHDTYQGARIIVDAPSRRKQSLASEQQPS